MVKTERIIVGLLVLFGVGIRLYRLSILVLERYRNYAGAMIGHGLADAVQVAGVWRWWHCKYAVGERFAISLLCAFIGGALTQHFCLLGYPLEWYWLILDGDWWVVLFSMS